MQTLSQRFLTGLLNYCTPFLKGYTLSQRFCSFQHPFSKVKCWLSEALSQGWAATLSQRYRLRHFSCTLLQGWAVLYPFSKVCFLTLVEASHSIHKCLELWNPSLVSPPVPVHGLPDGVHLDALADSLLQDVPSIIKHDGAAMLDAQACQHLS